VVSPIFCLAFTGKHFGRFSRPSRVHLGKAKIRVTVIRGVLSYPVYDKAKGLKKGFQG